MKKEKNLVTRVFIIAFCKMLQIQAVSKKDLSFLTLKPVAAAALKDQEEAREMILTSFFNLKVYQTNFMPFSLTVSANFWNLGG